MEVLAGQGQLTSGGGGGEGVGGRDGGDIRDLNLTFSVFDLRPSFSARICLEVPVS